MDAGGGCDLVVSEFAHGFEARLERRATIANFESVLRGSPGSAVVGLVAAGALLGLVLGRSKASALAGASIGGFAALAGVGVANAESSPQVTDAATRMLKAMSASCAGLAEANRPKARRASEHEKGLIGFGSRRSVVSVVSPNGSPGSESR